MTASFDENELRELARLLGIMEPGFACPICGGLEFEFLPPDINICKQCDEIVDYEEYVRIDTDVPQADLLGKAWSCKNRIKEVRKALAERGLVVKLTITHLGTMAEVATHNKKIEQWNESEDLAVLEVAFRAMRAGWLEDKESE